jgi:hypothetical protein
MDIVPAPPKLPLMLTPGAMCGVLDPETAAVLTTPAKVPVPDKVAVALPELTFTALLER